jgi:UPF0755 protein
MQYAKRILFTTTIFFILTCVTGTYAFFRYRQNQRKLRQSAQSPQETITLIEGWSVQEFANYLDKKGLIKAADFLALEQNYNVNPYPLLASKPAKADLEGFLFPDTYNIYTPSATAGPTHAETGDQIIKKTLDNFALKFTPQMQAQAQKLNMSIYQIVTLASIIEKETGRNITSATDQQRLDNEREIIAGIFYNRLKADMPLQSDATINFITKKNQPAASAQDLNIDSLYNTYKYKGLPPGPICNPSLSSLKAALFPQTTAYFYFLHKQPSGEAVFSQTYEQHLQNKAKYLK